MSSKRVYRPQAALSGHLSAVTVTAQALRLALSREASQTSDVAHVDRYPYIRGPMELTNAIRQCTEIPGNSIRLIK